MYESLRNLKLFDPVSIQHLIDNLNKKIAVIILKFAKIVYNILDVSL